MEVEGDFMEGTETGAISSDENLPSFPNYMEEPTAVGEQDEEFTNLATTEMNDKETAEVPANVSDSESDKPTEHPVQLNDLAPDKADEPALVSDRLTEHPVELEDLAQHETEEPVAAPDSLDDHTIELEDLGINPEEALLLRPDDMNANSNRQPLPDRVGESIHDEFVERDDRDVIRTDYEDQRSNGGPGGDNVSNVSYNTLEDKERLSYKPESGPANNTESMVVETSLPRTPPTPPRTPPPRKPANYGRGGGRDDVRCCDYALCRCLRRVPYATLFAFLLLAGGLALMTYEIIMIQETANDLFKGTVLDQDDSAYKKGLGMLLWLLIALVAVIAIFGFFFLVLACFSSGPSKKNTCGQRFVKCVNRVSISIVTIIAYLLCIAWIALSMALMLGLTFMLMVQSYCNSLGDVFTPESCVDLAQYGMVPSQSGSDTTSPAPEPTPTAMSGGNTTICGETLENFCTMHDDIKLNVWLTITASIIVVISLIHFLMALSANHTYLRVFRKGYRSVPKGTNAFPGFRYSDGELPIQEPVNMSDDDTRF